MLCDVFGYGYECEHRFGDRCTATWQCDHQIDFKKENAMFRKILSNQVGHGTVEEPKQFPVADCDKKYVTSTMAKEKIVDPPASHKLGFGEHIEDMDELRIRANETWEKLNSIHSRVCELPDSGERREFSTGSVRDIRDGKGRYDLISPIAMASLAKRMEDGMQKYGERNWEKGQNLMSYIDSCIRHINNFITDRMTNTISAEDHISAAFWNLHSFIHTKYMIENGLLPKELDDLPYRNRILGNGSKR